MKVIRQTRSGTLPDVVPDVETLWLHDRLQDTDGIACGTGHSHQLLHIQVYHVALVLCVGDKQMSRRIRKAVHHNQS